MYVIPYCESVSHEDSLGKVVFSPVIKRMS